MMKQVSNPALLCLVTSSSSEHRFVCAEQWEQGDDEEVSFRADYEEEGEGEEDDLQHSNGLVESVSGEVRHGAGRMDSLAESDLLQVSDGEDGVRATVGEMDIMEVLDDQPFEVLDCAGGTETSQEPSQLGEPCDNLSLSHSPSLPLSLLLSLPLSLQRVDIIRQRLPLCQRRRGEEKEMK